MKDYLVCFGGQVKAIGDGRLAGYLVTFGSADQTDTSSFKDFFTADTDFGVDEWPAKSAAYYHHGLDPELGKRRIGIGQMKTDEVGVWIEAQLQMRDEWEQAIYALAKAGKLSWSSGTASHLIVREPITDGAGKTVAHAIKHWPLGLDASLTPYPAEPRCQAVALKSLDVPRLRELVEGKPVAGETPPDNQKAADPAAAFDDVEEQLSVDAIRVLNDRLFYGPVWDAIYGPYGETDTPLPERLDTLRQAFDAFRDTSLRIVEAILTSAEGAETADDAMKAIRTLWGSATPAGLADHSAQVVSACGAYAQRLESRLDARLKAGRVLSEVNRQELEAVHEALDGLGPVKDRLRKVLDTACPANDAGAAKSAESARELERLKLRIRGTLALAGR